MALEIAHRGELERPFARFGLDRAVGEDLVIGAGRRIAADQARRRSPASRARVSIASSEGRWPVRLMLIGLSSSAAAASSTLSGVSASIAAGAEDRLLGRRRLAVGRRVQDRRRAPIAARASPARRCAGSGSRSRTSRPPRTTATARRQRVQDPHAVRQEVEALVGARRRRRPAGPGSARRSVSPSGHQSRHFVETSTGLEW